MEFKSLPGEKWAKVRGYENSNPIAAVSSFGRVARVYSDHWELAKVLEFGEKRTVLLHSVTFSKTWNVDVLVLDSFVGPRPKHHEILHLDEDTKNDKLENLKYSLGGAGLQKRSRSKKGIPIKLNAEKVATIRRLKAAGATYQELRKRYGISLSNLSKIVKRRIWKDVA